MFKQLYITRITTTNHECSSFIYTSGLVSRCLSPGLNMHSKILCVCVLAEFNWGMETCITAIFSNCCIFLISCIYLFSLSCLKDLKLNARKKNFWCKIICRMSQGGASGGLRLWWRCAGSFTLKATRIRGGGL